MINITRLASGAILLQCDNTELCIDAAAIPATLPTVILTLIDATKALGQARRDGYEAGLIVGHANGMRELEARYQREANEIAQGLKLLNVRAPMAA